MGIESGSRFRLPLLCDIKTVVLYVDQIVFMSLIRSSTSFLHTAPTSVSRTFWRRGRTDLGETDSSSTTMERNVSVSSRSAPSSPQIPHQMPSLWAFSATPEQGYQRRRAEEHHEHRGDRGGYIRELCIEDEDHPSTRFCAEVEDPRFKSKNDYVQDLHDHESAPSLRESSNISEAFFRYSVMERC